MTTALLYILVVLIWGSAWLAVKFQLGVVPPEISVAYRIGIAALCMFAWAWLKGLPLGFAPAQHRFLALQGMAIFSCNFIFFYLAATHLTTGLIAVLFSTASALTVIINALLMRRWPQGAVVAGATLGVIGIAIVFRPELAAFNFASGAGMGLLARIEAERAAYATVLFPVVALSLSTAFEGYRWTWAATLGILLIFAGNILVLKKNRAR